MLEKPAGVGQDLIDGHGGQVIAVVGQQIDQSDGKVPVQTVVQGQFPPFGQPQNGRRHVGLGVAGDAEGMRRSQGASRQGIGHAHCRSPKHSEPRTFQVNDDAGGAGIGGVKILEDFLKCGGDIRGRGRTGPAREAEQKMKNDTTLQGHWAP